MFNTAVNEGFQVSNAFKFPPLQSSQSEQALSFQQVFSSTGGSGSFGQIPLMQTRTTLASIVNGCAPPSFGMGTFGSLWDKFPDSLPPGW